MFGALEVNTRGLSSSAAAVEEGGRWVEGGAAEEEGRREAIGMGLVSLGSLVSKDQPGSKKLEGSSSELSLDAKAVEEY